MGFYHSLRRITGILSFSFILVACSSQKVQEPDLPERVYYDKAQQALSENLPSTAIKHLKDLDSRYPFGKFSTRAELDLIFAQVEAGEYIAAHATAERFIKIILIMMPLITRITCAHYRLTKGQKVCFHVTLG